MDSTPRPHGPVTIAELTAGLIWPKLLSAVGMSLRLPRLLIGTLTVMVLAAVLHGLDWIFVQFGVASVASSVHNAFNVLGDAVLSMSLSQIAMSLFDVVWGLAPTNAGTYPWAWWVILPILLLVWSIGGGAIARSVTVDAAGDLDLSMRQSLAFALARWKALFGALAIPLIVVMALSLVLIVAGWVMHGIIGPNAIGALLHGVALLIGCLIVLLTLCASLGQSMLLPAVSTEGTDAADAVQRCYAYVIGRPGRFIVYGLILLLMGLIAYGVLHWFAGMTWQVTSQLVGATLSDESRAQLRADSQAPGMTPAIMRGWAWVLWAFVSGWVVSYIHTAGTLLYLVMRRVCDEQDIREVWMPGLSPGSVKTVDAPAGSDADDNDEL